MEVSEMLRAVWDLGRFLAEERELDEIEILTQSHKLENVKKILFIVFRSENGNFQFERVYDSEYDPHDAPKYLYRTFRHGQYDAIPASKISARNASSFAEKITKRWNKWFNKYLKKYDHPLLSSLMTAMNTQRDIIQEEVSDRFAAMDKKERRSVLVTLKIIKNNNEKYLSDIDTFKNIFVEGALEDLFYKHNVFSRGEGICSLCLNKNTVYGFASPFSVFTVDKRGFAYNLSRENSWKQLPICSSCAIYLIAGKEFLEKHLRFSSYDHRYYVIPYFVFGKVDNQLIEEIEFGIDERLPKECYKRLLEDDIVDIMKEKEDTINLIFVFFKPKQKDFFDIVKYVENVPPSWIKMTSDAFCKTEERIIFKERCLRTIFGKEWSGDFLDGIYKENKLSKMNILDMTRAFFPESFVDIVGDILGAQRIEENYLIQAFIREIRKKFMENENWSARLLTLKSIYLLDFLAHMDLINLRERPERGSEKEVFVMEKKEDKSERVESFFEDFSEALDTSGKKAVFLEGVLASLLMNVQYAEKKSTPFRSKLHGLKLNQRKVKKLLPEVMEKLASYEAFQYKWLEKLVSKFFVEADQNGWSLSDDEISYYFTLGLNLGSLFKGGD
jgi:CRISPR-associated protein Csh1